MHLVAFATANAQTPSRPAPPPRAPPCARPGPTRPTRPHVGQTRAPPPRSPAYGSAWRGPPRLIDKLQHFVLPVALITAIQLQP